MKKLITILMLLPLMASAQKAVTTYAKLYDANGVQIAGDGMQRGYEKAITVLTLSTSGKNNSQVNFTMNISGAAADLKKAMTGKGLSKGQIVVLQPGADGLPSVQYSISMEDMQVRACAESVGCGGVTTTSVTLVATRIGWTYYSSGVKGNSSVSNKYGFDNSTGASWMNF
jgi:type VI protein secretion system component Hcp